MSYIRLRLPGGTLKLKPQHQLRSSERERRVPVWKLGGLYVVWWPHRFERRSASK